MKIEISGVRDGALWPGKGDELTVSDAEGAELIAQGYAEAITAAPKLEKATARKTAEKRA